MFWNKIDHPDYEEYYEGFEWESDQSDDALRAVLACEDRGIGFRCVTDDMDANLDYDEIIEIADKMAELNEGLNK